MANKKNKKNNALIFISIGVILFFTLYIIGNIFFERDFLKNQLNDLPKETIQEQKEEPIKYFKFLSLENFTEVEIKINENILTLTDKKNKCNAIIVAIDKTQAYSIEQGIKSEVSFRPMTHDILRDILEEYEIELLFVKITELKRNSYLARMILENENKILNLDLRPSDGIAIAVRKNKPVYVSEQVMRDAAEKIC
jgi:bifunctional DNase/RNase